MTYTDDEKHALMEKIVNAVARFQYQEGKIPDTAQGRAVIEAAAKSAQRLLTLNGDLPDDLTPIAIKWDRDVMGRSEPRFYFQLPHRTDEEMRRMEAFCAEQIAKIEGLKPASADRCPHCGQPMRGR